MGRSQCDRFSRSACSSLIVGLFVFVGFCLPFPVCPCPARRGRRAIWEELFTCGQKAQGLYDVSDTWQPDQVYFALAKLQDFAIEIPGAKPATGAK